MLQVSTGVQLVVYGVVLFGGLGGTAVVAVLLAGAAERAAARRTAIAAALGLAAWFAAAGAIAQAGFLGGGAPPPPAVLGLRFAAPLVLVALAFALFEPLRRLVSDADLQPSLIALQTFRVIGGMFLVLLALNALPAVFAVPAGVGDVLVGLTAAGAARSLRAGRTGPAVVWNLLGLLDLVIALTVGVVAAPGPLHLLTVTPSTAALGVLPLVLFPSFLVPFSVVLHAVSLRSLAAARATVRAYS
jgi:hypothetical protein